MTNYGWELDKDDKLRLGTRQNDKSMTNDKLRLGIKVDKDDKLRLGTRQR